MLDFDKYTRILDISTKKKPYSTLDWFEDSDLRNTLLPYCHWGQVKLFFSELEFLCICKKEGIDLADAVLIYIGSAPGTHIKYLTDIFKNLRCLLYDPAKFDIEEKNNIAIFSGKEGFFTDDTCEHVINHRFYKSSKYKLFISDIRSEAVENTIFKEMMDQQRWLLKLDADMSMLKFRLPYMNNDDWVKPDYDYSDIEKYIKKPTGRSCKNIDNIICYLKGDIYIQIYPPQYSTETRLIVNKKRDEFRMFNYNFKLYESKMFYYNYYIRLQPMVYKESNELFKHIIGLEPNYETCSQYYIAEQYCNAVGINPSLENITIFIYSIYEFHNNIKTKIGFSVADKTLTNCCMFNTGKKVFSPGKFEDFIKRKKSLTKEELLIQLYNLYNSIISIIKKQIDFFKNGNILIKSAYQMQIGHLEKNIVENEYLYNTFKNKIQTSRFLQ